MKKEQSYVIFDGTCGFCNSSAKFIAKKDVSDRFILIANTSEFGKELLKEHHLELVTSHSILLIKSGIVYVKSRAIRKVIEKIPDYRFLKLLLRVIPPFIQDLFYDAIAKIRQYLPIKTTCEIPEQEVRGKFRL
jgi:predicted DCC family thiol-disulfide oxidoreductase YuxK